MLLVIYTNELGIDRMEMDGNKDVSPDTALRVERRNNTDEGDWCC